MKLQKLLWIALGLVPMVAQASFIESTVGTAVVNDATATIFNPSALTVLKNTQIISLNSFADLKTNFSGQVTQSSTGFTQSGGANTQTNYFLPSLYFGKPISNQFAIGMAIVSNSFSRDIEDASILRYSQSSNNVKSIDFVPAVGFKFNDYFAIGAGLNFSRASFSMQPIIGFPTLNIPDTQSHNEASGNAVGGDVGILLTPSKFTTIGFDYRSAMSFRLTGQSIFEGNPEITSNNYAFNYWTPARSVLSINQMLTSTFGMIGTVQRLQFSIFRNLNIENIATPAGSINLSNPYYFRNTWLFTVGAHYRIIPTWIIRFATTYNQSPGNSNYQIVPGDSIILGASTGYNLTKNIIIDGSYAHAFIRNENIHILSGRNIILGVNQAVRDAVSLKLTVLI